MNKENIGRVLCCGDIHGAHKALTQVLERSKFDYKKDTLICLGDICDGWPETPQCIEELLKIKHMILIWGNHDKWAAQWLKFRDTPEIWTSQGGQATIDAYIKKQNLLDKHINFFEQAVKVYISEDNDCFVHGGIDKYINPLNTELELLCWDRKMLEDARWNGYTEKRFRRVFVGHTSTEKFSKNPIKYQNIWCLDQGAGWGGYLTIMDVATEEYWQSDRVKDLYPEIKGI